MKYIIKFSSTAASVLSSTAGNVTNALSSATSTAVESVSSLSPAFITSFIGTAMQNAMNDDSCTEFDVSRTPERIILYGLAAMVAFWSMSGMSAYVVKRKRDAAAALPHVNNYLSLNQDNNDNSRASEQLWQKFCDLSFRLGSLSGLGVTAGWIYWAAVTPFCSSADNALDSSSTGMNQLMISSSTAGFFNTSSNPVSNDSPCVDYSWDDLPVKMMAVELPFGVLTGFITLAAMFRGGNEWRRDDKIIYTALILALMSFVACFSAMAVEDKKPNVCQGSNGYGGGM
jgi:hypothetical protein